MSRGHGKVERWILEILDSRREITTVNWCAQRYAAKNGGDSGSRHLRSSFRRAARRLADEGLVDIWYCSVPTREYASGEFGNHRRQMCIAPPGYELTDRDTANIHTSGILSAR